MFGSKPCLMASLLPSPWQAGLKSALYALAAALAKLGNKTIICNDTGNTYACDGHAHCFCNASNSERFGGGAPGAVSLMDYTKARAPSCHLPPLYCAMGDKSTFVCVCAC